jgi:NADPH2:quinone reductase
MTTSPLQKTMRAAAIDRFGGVETLKMQTLPLPQVGPDEILIRVKSAGVGAWDPWEREGEFAKMFETEPRFPYVLGSEGAGTVAAVGERVRDFKEGDRVYAVRPFEKHKDGFYAEYAAVNAQDAARIPDKLTTEQAGAALADAVTGLRGLDDVLGVKRGESVMIFGASGGIGHMAVQLAKRIGARVFAVASGDDGVALAKRLGADVVVNGRKEDVAAAARKFAPSGMDAALITAGGEVAEKAMMSVREGGRVAYPNGVEPVPKARPTVKVTSYDGEADRNIIDKLNRLIEAGPFEVHVARTFPLEQAVEAHRALDQHYLGKLALQPIP